MTNPGSDDRADSASSAEWTILLYVGTKDGYEFTKAGFLAAIEGATLSARTNFVYELSTPDATERGVLTWDPTTKQIGAETLSTEPPIDVALPSHITKFVDWATTTFPSRFTALILKDHGGDDPPKAYGGGHEPNALGTDVQQKLRGGRAWLSPMTRTGARPLEILSDPKKDSYVSFRDLRRAIEKTRLGRVDVYGFDSCSLGLVELGFELRDVASYMVATQKVENIKAWPYRTILTAMATKGLVRPRAFATLCATADATALLCAVELAWMKKVGDDVSRLADALLDHVTRRGKTLEHLRKDLTSFGETPNFDLLQLFGQAQKAEGERGIGYDSTKAIAHLTNAWVAGAPPFPQGGTLKDGGAICAAGPLGIFFPSPKGSPFFAAYGSMRFARKTTWTKFIAAFCWPPS